MPTTFERNSWYVIVSSHRSQSSRRGGVRYRSSRISACLAASEIGGGEKPFPPGIFHPSPAFVIKAGIRALPTHVHGRPGVLGNQQVAAEPGGFLIDELI